MKKNNKILEGNSSKNDENNVTTNQLDEKLS